MSIENLTEKQKILLRLKEAVAALRLTPAEIARIIGYSKTQVGDILGGKTNLSDRFSKIFCSEFGISLKWLETSEGEMLKPGGLRQNVDKTEKPTVNEDHNTEWTAQKKGPDENGSEVLSILGHVLKLGQPGDYERRVKELMEYAAKEINSYATRKKT